MIIVEYKYCDVCLKTLWFTIKLDSFVARLFCKIK